MSEKNLLLVEDDDLQRIPLQRELEKHGFSVKSAADVASARALVDLYKGPFDVVILDVRLGPPGETTGLDLGFELRSRQEWSDWPAEFLICSAYGERDYYRLALKLGAAAYLEKERKFDLYNVTRHVRALALRRAFSIERPDALATIDSIAKTSCDEQEAARRFCREVLRGELLASLGAPFVLLWTDSTGTYGFSNSPELPPGPHPAYETVQALTQGRTGVTGPLILKPSLMESPIPLAESSVLSRLRDTAFIPLFSDRAFRLSLGILPSASLGDDPGAFATVLSEYFRPAVFRHLLTLTTKWAELYVHRLAVLTATSQLCLYVGQEQLTLLDDAREKGEIAETGFSFGQLQLLAEDLQDAGEILGELAREERTSAREQETTTEGRAHSLVSMREIVEVTWAKTSRMLDLEADDVFVPDGNCNVRGRREYLEIATSRILQWFIQRLRVATPSVEGTSIWVICRETVRGTEVVFRDRSRKLSKRLRERLFVPFSQTVYLPLAKADLRGPGLHLPLYMAKALVELGSGGLLEDATDDEGEFGNQLVMRFPPPSAPEVSRVAN